MIRNSANISRNFLKACEFILTYNNVTKFNVINKNIYLKNRITPNLINYQHLYFCTQQNDSPTPSKDNDNVYGKLTDEQVKSITGDDENLKRKLKLLMLEIEVLRQDGQNAPTPEYLNILQWKELLSKETKSARKKYLSFLFKSEKTRENKKIKKEKLREERQKLYEKQQEESNENDDSIKYGLGNNTIFIRVYDTTMNQQTNSKLIQAMQFGQPLVIDCSYDQYMIQRERINTAKQLMLLFAENRVHSDPFNIHLCNVDVNSEVTKALHRHIPTLFEPWFPLNVHTKSYLDLFPKDQLVYMTPHCRHDLIEYDHDAVYIIGAMVDKITNEPLSLAKAKKAGLKMRRLPLDRYLSWNSGSGKTLTLNQVVAILNDIKFTGDWKYALRHVPRRKIFEPDYDSLRDKLNKPVSRQFEKRNIRIFKNSTDFDREKSKIRRKMKTSVLLDNVFKN